MSARRGHIYEVLLPKFEEHKLGLVVSSDVVSEFLKPVVVQITSHHALRALPTFIRLAAGEGGLNQTSYALCHELHALDEEAIAADPLGGMIPFGRMVEVEAAIRCALDLEQAA